MDSASPKEKLLVQRTTLDLVLDGTPFLHQVHTHYWGSINIIFYPRHVFELPLVASSSLTITRALGRGSTPKSLFTSGFRLVLVIGWAIEATPSTTFLTSKILRLIRSLSLSLISLTSSKWNNLPKKKKLPPGQWAPSSPKWPKDLQFLPYPLSLDDQNQVRREHLLRAELVTSLWNFAASLKVSTLPGRDSVWTHFAALHISATAVETPIRKSYKRAGWLDVGAIFHSSPSLDMRRIWLRGDYTK